MIHAVVHVLYVNGIGSFSVVYAREMSDKNTTISYTVTCVFVTQRSYKTSHMHCTVWSCIWLGHITRHYTLQSTVTRLDYYIIADCAFS